MKKTKILITTLFLIFLSSCKTKFGKYTMCEVSFEFDRCLCFTYDLDKLKSEDDAKEYPLSYCDGIVGFNIDDVAKEILPKAKYYKRKGCR